MKFRMKPVFIDAIQFTGDNLFEVAEFMGKTLAEFQITVDAILRTDGMYGENTHIHTRTREGVMTANYGDWIIKGGSGEYYPCKPDIFENTYEKVEE